MSDDNYIDPFTSEEVAGDKKEGHGEANVCISCEG